MNFVCTKCGKDQPESERVARRRVCRSCRYSYVDRWRAKNPTRQRDKEREYRARVGDERNRTRRDCPSYELLRNARGRALARGLEFSIREADIVPLPERCPVLGIPLISAKGRPVSGSYSLDRVDPKKGYVPGNVAVISHRANTIKSDASPEELARVLAYVLQHSCYTPGAKTEQPTLLEWVAKVVAQVGVEPTKIGCDPEAVAAGCP